MSTIRCPNPSCGAFLEFDNPIESPIRCTHCGSTIDGPAPSRQGSLGAEKVLEASPASSLGKTEKTTLDLPASPPPGSIGDSPRRSPDLAPHTLTSGARTATPGPSSGSRPAPERIGRFRIYRFVGEGGFGRVYEAYDPQLDRTVAVKVAKVGRPNEKEQAKRFLRVRRTAARNLRHPNIVPVFDSGQDGEELFIASASSPGKSPGVSAGRPLRQPIPASPRGRHDRPQVGRGGRRATPTAEESSTAMSSPATSCWMIRASRC